MPATDASSQHLAEDCCDAPSFIHGHHMGYVSIGFCLAPIHVSERLAVSIKHLEAAGNLLDRPMVGSRLHSASCLCGRPASPIAIVAITFVRPRPDTKIATRIVAEVPVRGAIVVGIVPSPSISARLGPCVRSRLIRVFAQFRVCLRGFFLVGLLCLLDGARHIYIFRHNW